MCPQGVFPIKSDFNSFHQFKFHLLIPFQQCYCSENEEMASRNSFICLLHYFLILDWRSHFIDFLKTFEYFELVGWNWGITSNCLQWFNRSFKASSNCVKEFTTMLLCDFDNHPHGSEVWGLHSYQTMQNTHMNLKFFYVLI